LCGEDARLWAGRRDSLGPQAEAVPGGLRACPKLNSSVMFVSMPSRCSRLHASMPSQVEAILMYTRDLSTPLEGGEVCVCE
jgi:hypothetical protein